MKNIYCVKVENEFYCVAENQNEAEKLYDEAKRDFSDWAVWADRVVNTKYIPEHWLESLTYGEKEDIKLKDWIAGREKEEAEAKKQAELAARQLKLF